jgi:hypothetical protein
MVVLLLLGTALGAQVDPRGKARTFRTEHFRVHFLPEHEMLARRAAAYGERAWTALAAELAEPDAPVELLVADNIDAANGTATTYPTNRIVVFALPPHMIPELRHYDDWLDLVVTHELAHIFHLDRSRGVWALGRKVLGRNPALFPNLMLPSWIIEGLAVHYETALTGSGRLAATEWPQLARAAALERRVPPPGAWSLESSRFPLGQHAYGWGSLLMTQLAASRDSGMRRFVDQVGGQLLPWRLDHSARRAFGTSFTQGFRMLRDSVTAHAESTRVLTRPDSARRRHAPAMTWFAAQPRWDRDGTLLVTVADGRDVPGLYRARASGARLDLERVSRRNSLDATTVGPDGTLAFAQLEFDDPFVLRSRLWRTDARGRERLVAGTDRVVQPDARADGELVAVRATTGSTELVRVHADGTVRTLAPAHVDTAWTEPRWHPRGDVLVAVRLLRGGVQQVVLLDTLGTVTAVVHSARGIASGPTFTADGARVIWSGDRTGRLQLEIGDAREGGGAEVRTLTRSLTGVSAPAVSPDGTEVAALEYTLAGRQLVVYALHDGYTDEPYTPGAPRYAPTSRLDAVAPTVTAREAPSRPYQAWPQLLPRWWMPVVGEGSDGAATVGAYSSGFDIRRRHLWAAQLTRHPARGEMEGSAAWRVSTLPARAGWQPFVDVSSAQQWERFALVDSARDPLGDLARRARFASAALTLSRPRVRTSASLSLGAAVERRAYRTEPEPLLGGLDPQFARGITWPSVFLSGAFSNTMRAGRAVSLEDGVAVSGFVQRRWRDDRPELASWRATGAVRGYTSIDWPGFARHALAVRASGGLTDRNATTELSLGGTSGALMELLPGLVVGDPARLFPVRGFAPGVQRGARVLTGSVEYRAPLALPARAPGLLPLFLDRVSTVLFADAGRAWCPASVRGGSAASVVCLPAGVRDGWLGSAGAELALDLGVPWDLPARARLGLARAVARPADVPGRGAVYVTFGTSF